jgi:HlyD family secretion protein
LARREKEVLEARAALDLLEVGSRPEEVEAERARLARLEEEARHLTELQEAAVASSPVAGVVTTQRLREKVGQYVKEGDLIAVVEDPSCLEAEVTLGEQDAARVRAGQEALLKARALPFQTITVKVDRIAPAAEKQDAQRNVTAYCRVDEVPEELRSQMGGHARIATGRRAVGAILLDRVLRLVRTEFWW